MFNKLAVTYLLNSILTPCIVSAIPYDVTQAWYETDGLIDSVFSLWMADTVGTTMRALQIPPLLKRHLLTRLTRSQEKANRLWRPENLFVGELYANALKTLAICLVYGPIWPLSYLLTPVALVVEYFCFSFAIFYWWGPAPQLTDELLHRMRRWIGVVMCLRWTIEVIGLSKARPERVPEADVFVRVVLNAVLLGAYFIVPPSRYFPSLRRLRYDEVATDGVAHDEVPKHRGHALAEYDCPTLGNGRDGGARALAARHDKAAHGFELFSSSARQSVDIDWGPV